MKTSEIDYRAALKAIIMTPQAYHGRGPAFCVEEMKRIASEALDGKWVGVADSCACGAPSCDLCHPPRLARP